MNVILLSGGSGKRLWPLSNDIRSKQFIKLFKTADGEYESMVQRILRQLKSADETAFVTIATEKKQVSSIRNQLGKDIDISVEPCRRDTFPAIALAAEHLYDKGLGRDEGVIVCPVDPYVDESYFSALKDLSETVKTTDKNLWLMGISPTYPSEKYGYIIPKNGEKFSDVSAFKEKPDKKTAEEYIKHGALWNGGVFGFRLGYLLDIAHKNYDYTDYGDLYEKYPELEKISFDYAVVEKEKNVGVMRFGGEWKDVGTWNTLSEATDEKIIGNGIISGDSDNVNILNELDIPILCMGIKNAVISASPDGILVSDKEQSSYIKPIVENLGNEIMYAEKSWGSYRVIDVGVGSLTVKVTLNAGHGMHCHSHSRRDERWVITEGSGEAFVDGTKFSVTAGDCITVKAGEKHYLSAGTRLTAIEIQTGYDIDVRDKIVYD